MCGISSGTNVAAALTLGGALSFSASAQEITVDGSQLFPFSRSDFTAAEADVENKRAVVQYTGEVSDEALVSAVKEAGYEAKMA